MEKALKLFNQAILDNENADSAIDEAFEIKKKAVHAWKKACDKHIQTSKALQIAYDHYIECLKGKEI